MIQHCISGFLCLPSTFGVLFSPATARLMAVHGATNELGFELCQTLMHGGQSLWLIFGKTPKTEEEKVDQKLAKESKGLWKMMFVHHFMQFLCVIPMNIYFREERLYHELVYRLNG